MTPLDQPQPTRESATESMLAFSMCILVCSIALIVAIVVMSEIFEGI